MSICGKLSPITTTTPSSSSFTTHRPVTFICQTPDTFTTHSSTSLDCPSLSSFYCPSLLSVSFTAPAHSAQLHLETLDLHLPPILITPPPPRSCKQCILIQFNCITTSIVCPCLVLSIQLWSRITRHSRHPPSNCTSYSLFSICKSIID